MRAALETESLGHRYGRGVEWALLDVDLAIRPGTITALVGPNGAGKSTLIRSWIGFERPTRGSAFVVGIDAAKDPARAARAIGYVSQSGGLYRGLSVQDHLRLAASLRHGFDRALAALRLGQLGIPLGRKVGELSGGQEAHVQLAIALGTRAPVLLLDEPLAALDPLARHEFLAVLAEEVRSRGATALLSSHIVNDIEPVCDSVIVLGGGRVILDAPITTARATHRIAAAGSSPGGRVVASFTRVGGEPSVLIRSEDARLRPPTFEELVMGYLAAARAPRHGRTP